MNAASLTIHTFVPSVQADEHHQRYRKKHRSLCETDGTAAAAVFLKIPATPGCFNLFFVCNLISNTQTVIEMNQQ